MWLQHNRDSEVRVSFQYGGEPSALMDLWWFVSHAVLRGKRPLLEQGDRQRIRHGLRKVEGPAVLALGVPSAQLTLTTGLGLGPGGREPTKEPVASGRLE